MSEGLAVVSSLESQRKKGDLQIGSESQPGSNSLALGCRSPWDPQSLRGNKKFMPEKGNGML